MAKTYTFKEIATPDCVMTVVMRNGKKTVQAINKNGTFICIGDGPQGATFVKEGN